MKILVTAFEPFGGEQLNPALEAIKLLPSNVLGCEIICEELPTVFDLSIKRLIECVARQKPDVVICVGQAGGRSEMTIERIAINLDDAAIPDNKGEQPIDRVIDQDGEAAYFSGLPIKAIVKNMREKGIPASVSNSAGTFVCNHIMYGLLNYINKCDRDIRGGFIHVPYIPDQVIGKKDAPYIQLEDIVAGLVSAIQTCVICLEDIKAIEGKIC